MEILVFANVFNINNEEVETCKSSLEMKLIISYISELHGAV